MKAWYRVEISGRYDGKPLTLGPHYVLAQSAEHAALSVIAGEFGHDIEWDNAVRGTGGPLAFWLGSEEEARVFTTVHRTFEAMAVEIRDASTQARLDGAPMLPLELGS